jgi:hypothetical protein
MSLGRGRRLSVLPLIAVAALIATSASPAGAAVTIGSNLGREPDLASQYSPRPTFGNVSLASDRQALGGLSSPVNGTVVRWRIRVGDVTEVTNFRIIRPLAGGVFTGAGTSASVTPPINATTSYDLQLPIQIGDYIGIDCCNPGPAEFFVTGNAATRNEWQPSLADGGPGRAPSGTNPYEIAINADIEPDCDKDGLGDESQDADVSACHSNAFTFAGVTRNKKKGTATVKLNVPEPGELIGSGKGAKVAAAEATTSKAVTPGTAQLLIKAKGKKKRKLNETGKVKLTVAVTYTPTGGKPNTQSIKVKLKKRL